MGVKLLLNDYYDLLKLMHDNEAIILDEKVYSNADLSNPLAPSDTAVKFIEFLEGNRKEWGFAKDVFILINNVKIKIKLLKYIFTLILLSKYMIE